MFILLALLRSSPTGGAHAEDEHLLQAIASGQSAALGTLYDRYGRLVFSLACRILNDEGAAEEVTQEVFLQVWAKAGTYRSETSKVSTWLTSVARHRAIDRLRQRNVRPEGHQMDWDDPENDEEPTVVDPMNVEANVEQDMQRQVIRQALGQLPRDQREALALAYFQGLSHQEIAEATGEPLGTVKTRIRLAMQKLRQLLEAPV